MAKGSKKDGKGGDTLPPEDSKLWRAYTAQEVDPLEPSIPLPPRPHEKPVKSPIKPHLPMPSLRHVPQKPETQAPQLDLRTDQKLRRGKMTIEARLDMHGYTQAQAHQALNSFLLKCHSLGMRCVLIITGKGLKSLDNLAAPARGVLNRNLPIWIKEAPLKEIVLKASPAAIKDGGAGAYYVYLKRKRNY